MSVSAIASGYGSGAATYMQQIASGKKINSAADNSAGLAIAQRLQQSSTTAKVSSNNYQDQINKNNVADSVYSGMNDYMQEINAQSVRSQNGLLSSSDQQSIADYVGQLSQGMNQLAETTYNGQSLVSSSAVSGISGANFDLSSIDSAVASLSSAQSANGAATNGLEYASAVADTQYANETAALSGISDTDIADAVTGLSRENTLDQTKVMLQKQMMEDEQQKNMALFV
ncbi:MAG: hypothetical protein K6A23_06880 [Butyrivibrio sp.]|nr:hypothetical protein [Butyrivibrio sp.]